jgi:hypothetical protein
VWSATFEYVLPDNANTVRMVYRIRTDRQRSILYFGGPSFRAGEGSFGADKDEGLFPGLEWLAAGEPSSSTLNVRVADHLRITPHPRKITIPLMAITDEGRTVSLLWDMTGERDGGFPFPSAVFDSPNRLENAENHLMGLFAPSVASGNVPENSQEATTPLVLKPGEPIEIKACLSLSLSDTALSAVQCWLDTYGLPGPQPLPRTIEEEIDLCRKGFDTMWDDDEKGYHNHIRSPADPNRTYASLDYFDALRTMDPSLKSDLMSRAGWIVSKTVEELGPGGLSRPSQSHVWSLALPFFVGRLPESAASNEEFVGESIAKQETDGSWTYVDNHVPSLGEEGACELGTCLAELERVLHHAVVFGGREALESGLKGLTYIERFRIPRGAQTWEAPLHMPDVLASAIAIRCCLYGYRLTGDPHYLERAAYWANTSLPFFYMWQDPGVRAGMLYACSGAWGATNYTQPVWFGVPVQWPGLCCANALFELSEFDPDPVWRTVATGILTSAMYQQSPEDAEYPGTYFDAWYLLTGRFVLPMAPEAIIKNVYRLEGIPFDVTTRIWHTDRGNVHLSGVGSLQDAIFQREEGRLSWRHGYFAGETSHVFIAGIPRPGTVLVDGIPIPKVTDLGTARTGYLIDEARNNTYLKIGHHSSETNVELRFRPDIPQATATPTPPASATPTPAPDPTPVSRRDKILGFMPTWGQPAHVRISDASYDADEIVDVDDLLLLIRSLRQRSWTD